jgi:hypothetical protein
MSYHVSKEQTRGHEKSKFKVTNLQAIQNEYVAEVTHRLYKKTVSSEQKSLSLLFYCLDFQPYRSVTIITVNLFYFCQELVA